MRAPSCCARGAAGFRPYDPAAQGDRPSVALAAQELPGPLDLRMMAADRFGSASAWTSARRVTVDSTPPSISLSASTLSAFADNLLVPAEAGLSGQVQDDRQARWARPCASRPG